MSGAVTLPSTHHHRASSYRVPPASRGYHLPTGQQQSHLPTYLPQQADTCPGAYSDEQGTDYDDRRRQPYLKRHAQGPYDSRGPPAGPFSTGYPCDYRAGQYPPEYAHGDHSPSNSSFADFSQDNLRRSRIESQPYWPVSQTASSSNYGVIHSRDLSGGYRGSIFDSNSGDGWEPYGKHPQASFADSIHSPALSNSCLESNVGSASKPSSQAAGKGGRLQRRPTNRDEFDGPHQFLQKPHPDVVARQERELPHLPTSLSVQEQGFILNSGKSRLSQCAYDFVAKYQFPIPLTQDMRPVEHPEDREWTEWVDLMRRLATKRRIPARVLYNGQIKKFVTVLNNSVQVGHTAENQSGPPKDDRNVLQLISASIQVAKILKDASAMEYLDNLYNSTAEKIEQRSTR